MTFIIVTKDFSGLGFAVMLLEEGNEVIVAYKNDDLKAGEKRTYENVGKNLVEKFPLEDVLKSRRKFKDAYWIFDQNIHEGVADALHKEGFKVFGGSKFMEKMEHDRSFAVDFMKQSGLDIPDTHEFSNLPEGIAFLEQNPDDAFVYKPDETEEAWQTFVPSSWEDDQANHELLLYMKTVKDTGEYILQKRIKGVEVNVEAWFYEGEPFFAFVGLENKRKLNRDAGSNVGCAQDIDFVVALDAPIVQKTIGRTFPQYKEMKYTGFADVNCIIADNKYYFLEVCNRFGYNSHPNLFRNLAIDPTGQILADFIDGNIQGMYERFRLGFGASISLYTDNPRQVPLIIKGQALEKFYHFDTFMVEDQLSIAGWAKEVGILCHYGSTIEEAASECISMIDVYEDITFPDISYRSDLGKDDWPTAPIRRFRALQTMKLL